MNSFKSAEKLLRRAVFAILMVGVLLLTPVRAAHAGMSAEYSSHPGAPDNPHNRQETVYQGRADRNVVNGGAQSHKMRDSVVDRVKDTLKQDDSDRPKTTGQWMREARQTEGEPGNRLERIAKETGEAVKDFGQVYPDTAKRSGEALRDQ